MTQRISSNATLLLKIFIPTLYITFFGLFSVAVLFSDRSYLPFGGAALTRIVIPVVFLVFLALMYFTVLRLKRVDLGQDGIYVSNYFKTFRYAYKDIQGIAEKDYGLFNVGTITLKEKGKFGKKIYFLISKIHYQNFIEKHPDLFSHLLQ